MAETVGIRRIGQIAVVVSDPARAKAFYGDVLQLTHLFDAPPDLSFFDCGGVRLMLTPAEAEGSSAASSAASTSPSSILYLDVREIDVAHRVLADRGVVFEQAPHRVADLGDRDLWLAFFRDPESNLLALMSEVAKVQGVPE